MILANRVPEGHGASRLLQAKFGNGHTVGTEWAQRCFYLGDKKGESAKCMIRLFFFGSGGWIRTNDLRVMRLILRDYLKTLQTYKIYINVSKTIGYINSCLKISANEEN